MDNQKKEIFTDFGDFWSCTKRLDSHQRNKIFSSLTEKEQKRLDNSYKIGGWEDCFMRNKVDNILDGIKKDFDVDMQWISARAVVQRKCFYMKKTVWNWISDILNRNNPKHTQYILGGIDVEDVDEKMVCIIPKRNL